MISNDNIVILTQLIGVGLKIRNIESLSFDINNISKAQWQQIYDLAQEQGVLAIVFDAISDSSIVSLIPKDLKFRWIAAVSARERNYLKQYNCAKELANEFKQKGIVTTVLKGLSIASYYPIPAHREFGDFDCFLGDDYELGNQIAENIGAKVERDYYRHSHIYYKRLMVENHQFCVGVRGSKTMKMFEKHLRAIMHNQDEFIDGDLLIKPSSDFNALFLTSHAMTHFLVEGIKLRHICDWALLLHHEQDTINWMEFYQWTDKLRYTKFANILTGIAIQFMGLEIHNPSVRCEDMYADYVLDDIFCQNSIFNKGYGVWKSRIISIKNRLKSLWKFKVIYQRSVFATICEQVLGFIFDRRPTI